MLPVSAPQGYSKVQILRSISNLSGIEGLEEEFDAMEVHLSPAVSSPPAQGPDPGGLPALLAAV